MAGFGYVARGVVAVVCACGALALGGNSAGAESVTVVVPEGVPLRVEVHRGYPLKKGTPITGYLIESVYVGSRLVIEKGALVHGHITEMVPAPGNQRRDALLNGDFTPLKQAVIEFSSLDPAGESAEGRRAVPMRTHVIERTAPLVEYDATKKREHGIVGDVHEQITEKKNAALDTVTAPNKMNRLRRFLYRQLPFHPQEVWAGTQFDAELTEPLVLQDNRPEMPAAPEGAPLTGKVEARLTTALDSATTKQGTVVHAISTRPVLDPKTGRVLLPEGADLTGVVLNAKPAKSFGRAGTLRFTFRKIEAQNRDAEVIHGQVTGAEGKKGENIKIDAEGGTSAQPDQGRFLAPLVLGVLAAHAQDDDGNQTATGAVSSNGFGLIARVVSIAAASPQVTTGFAAYGFSRSVYKRWIARGHDVTFAKDALLVLELTPR